MSDSSPSPRIPPLEPPYDPPVEAGLQRMTPRSTVPERPNEPLKFFRTLVRHPRLAAAMMPLGGFVLGSELALDLHDRELLIDRVCARCHCEYEWGVHARTYAGKAGLSPEQVAATVTARADDSVWSERDALLVQLVDELHDTSQVSDALWARLTQHWDETQRFELLLVTGWYHAICYLVNGIRVSPETWASRFPSAR